MTGRQSMLTAHPPEGAGPLPAGTAPPVVAATPGSAVDSPRAEEAAAQRCARRVEQIAAAALVAGAFTLPLVIYLGAADSFALPKSTLMVALTVVLAGCLAFLRWRQAPTARARSPWTVDVLLVYLAHRRGHDPLAGSAAQRPRRAPPAPGDAGLGLLCRRAARGRARPGDSEAEFAGSSRAWRPPPSWSWPTASPNRPTLTRSGTC